MNSSNSEFRETQVGKQDTNATSNLLAKPEHDSTSHIEVPGKAVTSQAQAATGSQHQLAVTPDATHATSAQFDNALTSPAKQLLSLLWPSAEKTHQLGTLNRQTEEFRNISVSSIDEACQLSQKLSKEGLDAYFAIAEYASAANRTANNAVSASTFIVDIDVGTDEWATVKGYATLDEALKALDEFCVTTNLPKPNHVVGSGNGFHGYWILSDVLEREKWLLYAAKFKALMKSAGLRADPSRTADIASVLRVPGTLNHKDSPPRPVETISSSNELIALETMLDAIEAAMMTLPVVTNAQVENSPVAKPVQACAPMAPKPFEEDIDRAPPNLRILASALKTLSPDCDEEKWTLHRLAPMAYESRYFPALHDKLYKLTRDWSSGDLGGVPSTKWNEPGSNGMSGKQYFDRVWRRFLNDNYTRTRISLGTIFWDAKKAGWEYSHDDSGDADPKEVS